MSMRQLRQMVAGLFAASPDQVFTVAGICYLLRHHITPAPCFTEVEGMCEAGVRNDFLEKLADKGLGPEYRLKKKET